MLTGTLSNKTKQKKSPTDLTLFSLIRLTDRLHMAIDLDSEVKQQNKRTQPTHTCDTIECDKVN